MKVTLNTDTFLVRKIKEALKNNDGYCPCTSIKSDDTKCMCKDFRDKLSDESFQGLCHCGLYIKTND